jgi:hypothetical protein
VNSPSIISQKYVALDTSTWIDLFRRREDPESKDVIAALNSGRIIPYVTFDHVLELLQHDDQKTRIDVERGAMCSVTVRTCTGDVLSSLVDPFAGRPIEPHQPHR